MESTRVGILVAAVVLFFVGTARVSAVIEFNDGGVWDIDYEINDDVSVDYASPGMETTVNMVDGGSIPSYHALESFEDSSINILGGSIYRLYAHERSQVAVSGGSIGDLIGLLRDGLWARDSSQVTVSGGSIGGALEVWGYSQVAVSGGLFAGELWLWDNAVLTIAGSDFAVDGTDVGYTELTSILGLGCWDEPYPQRRLTGTLLNGDPLNNVFRIGHNARIILVPEPAALLLLGFGGLLQVRIRRSR